MSKAPAAFYGIFRAFAFSNERIFLGNEEKRLFSESKDQDKSEKAPRVRNSLKKNKKKNVFVLTTIPFTPQADQILKFFNWMALHALFACMSN